MISSMNENAPKKRCGSALCKTKLALTDLTCSKCQVRFCRSHRLPELHACPHDFRKEGQVLLSAQNPVVSAEKIEHI